MNGTARLLKCCALSTLFVLGMVSRVPAMELHLPLESYVQEREQEFATIPEERRVKLEKLAEFVAECRAKGEPAKLTFICTHNSRRSHFAQVWSGLAAARHGLDHVQTYSGGTETTAMNERSVAALQRAGWLVEGTPVGPNPRYRIRPHEAANGWECYSKVFDQPPNPTRGFCAVMTCSDADESCPSVVGALRRVAIPYEDPRHRDGQSDEADAYDATSRQIAREMLYVFSRVQRAN
jgi:arsenate reductase (thioredoxin)